MRLRTEEFGGCARKGSTVLLYVFDRRSTIARPMLQYHQLLRLVLDQGKFKPDRTGTGTHSVFGAQARFPLV